MSKINIALVQLLIASITINNVNSIGLFGEIGLDILKNIKKWKIAELIRRKRREADLVPFKVPGQVTAESANKFNKETEEKFNVYWYGHDVPVNTKLDKLSKILDPRGYRNTYYSKISRPLYQRADPRFITYVDLQPWQKYDVLKQIAKYGADEPIWINNKPPSEAVPESLMEEWNAYWDKEHELDEEEMRIKKAQADAQEENERKGHIVI